MDGYYIIDTETNNKIKHTSELVDGKEYKVRCAVQNKVVTIAGMNILYGFTIKNNFPSKDNLSIIEIKTFSDVNLNNGDIIETFGKLYIKCVDETTKNYRYTFITNDEATKNSIKELSVEQIKELLA